MVIEADLYSYLEDQIYDAIGGKDNAPRQYVEDIGALMVYLRNGKKLDGKTTYQVDDMVSKVLSTLKEGLRGRNKGDPNIPPELRKRMTEGTATISLELGKYREPLLNMETNLFNEWKDLLGELGNLLGDFYEQGTWYVEKTRKLKQTKPKKLKAWCRKLREQYRTLNFGRLIDKISINISRLNRLEKDMDSWAALAEGNKELTNKRDIEKLAKKANKMAAQLRKFKSNLEDIQSEIDRFIQGREFSDEDVKKWFTIQSTTISGKTMCFTIYYQNCIELLKASRNIQNLTREFHDEHSFVSGSVGKWQIVGLRNSIYNNFRKFTKFKTKIEPSKKSGTKKEIEEIDNLLYEIEKVW